MRSRYKKRKPFLKQIDILEVNLEISPSEKLTEIKKIRDQLDKVGMEIDMIIKEINLLNTYRVN